MKANFRCIVAGVSDRYNHVEAEMDLVADSRPGRSTVITSHEGCWKLD